MRHGINPKIDCVFKALLASEDHKDLLIHFLNAMVYASSDTKIVSVELLNPYNEKEFISDKLSIVDVKARDQDGQIYQIEIQLSTYLNLPARMLYVWCDLYSQQLNGGDDYQNLNTVHSLWLVDGRVFRDDRYYRQFKMQDHQQQLLINHGGIIVVELPKFNASNICTDQARWVRFFNDAESFTDLQNLPNWMQTPEMEQAMSVLEKFSEKEIAYHQYQARQNYLREQKAIKADLLYEQMAKETALARESAALADKDAALARENAALARENAALADKDAALAEIKALKQQLANIKK